jgi:hypothetical protein
MLGEKAAQVPFNELKNEIKVFSKLFELNEMVLVF